MARNKLRTRTFSSALRGQLAKDDRGIAMPMALMVFIVGVALITAFLLAITGSSRVTATSKTNVQSQAAAEAGIAAATLALQTTMSAGADVCGTTVPPSTTAPVYTVTLACSSSGVTPETLTIESRGVAPGGAAQKVQAVYPLQRTSQSPPLALRTGKTLTISSNANLTHTDPNKPANMYVEEGDLECNAGGRIDGSVYVLKGKATLGGACPIAGDLYAFGDISIPNGKVAGNVVSITGSVKISGGGKVGKNVSAAKDVDVKPVNGVGGNVHAGRDVIISNDGSSIVVGSVTYGRTKSIPSPESKYAPGGVAQGAPPVLTMPNAPVWVDLTMPMITGAGFKSEVWSAPTQCTVPNHGEPAALTALKNLSTPSVVDARSACPSGVSIEYWGYNLSIKTDIVIVAHSFFLRGFNITSADGLPHKVWFVVLPPKTCPTTNGGTDFTTDSVNFSDGKVTALAYTPCNVKFGNSGALWRGSVFSGSFSGTPLFNYNYIGLPGEETTGGWGGGGAAKADLTALISQRNVK